MSFLQVYFAFTLYKPPNLNGIFSACDTGTDLTFYRKVINKTCGSTSIPIPVIRTFNYIFLHLLKSINDYDSI